MYAVWLIVMNGRRKNTTNLKDGENETIRIMVASVTHVTPWVWRTKYNADGFLFDRVYINLLVDLLYSVTSTAITVLAT